MVSVDNFFACFGIVVFWFGVALCAPVRDVRAVYSLQSCAGSHVAAPGWGMVVSGMRWVVRGKNPGRFAPKPFPPLVVSPPRRFPPGRFPPSRFAPTIRFAPLVVSPPSRFAPIMLKKKYSRGITYITMITANKQINNVYISFYT